MPLNTIPPWSQAQFSMTVICINTEKKHNIQLLMQAQAMAQLFLNNTPLVLPGNNFIEMSCKVFPRLTRWFTGNTC